MRWWKDETLSSRKRRGPTPFVSISKLLGWSSVLCHKNMSSLVERCVSLHLRCFCALETRTSIWQGKCGIWVKFGHRSNQEKENMAFVLQSNGIDFHFHQHLVFNPRGSWNNLNRKGMQTQTYIFYTYALRFSTLHTMKSRHKVASNYGGRE